MRGEHTARRILDAAVRAFGTEGYAATSLDEIADEVGIRKQSLLYHFPGKEELFAAAALQAAADVFEALDGALRDDDPGGLDRLDSLVASVHDLASRRPEVIGLVREVARAGPPLSDRVAEALKPLVDAAVAWLVDAMTKGEVRRQDPQVALLTIYSAVVGHLTESSVRKVLLDGCDARAAQGELVSFLRAALSPPVDAETASASSRPKRRPASLSSDPAPSVPRG